MEICPNEVCDIWNGKGLYKLVREVGEVNVVSESLTLDLLHRWLGVITSGYIEELDDEGRLRNNEYLHYEVIDEECDGMGEMCDLYEGL